MGAGKMLSLDERKQIQGFHTEGLSHREIARRIGRSSSAVRRFLKDPDGYHTKLGTGRPPKLAPEDVDRLLRAASESQASARELRDGLGLDVSVSRVNGYLRHAQRRRSSLTPVSGGIPAVATAGVDQQEADELPLALGISGSDAQEPASSAGSSDQQNEEEEEEDPPLAPPASFPNKRRRVHTSSVPVPATTSAMLSPSRLASRASPRRAAATVFAGGRQLFHSEVQKSELICTQGFINGKWVDAKQDARYSVVDPATEKEIARVASMGQEETSEAIAAALAAQREWKKTTPLVRSKLLKKWHASILEHVDDLGVIASAESGKPLAEAKGEVAYAAGFLEYYAHEILHSDGFVVPAGAPGHRMMAVKEPVGVCGIITPWNFPLAMITRKLGPCLAAGCSAVIKPAAETPLSALALAKLAEEAGIPAGLVNIVPGPHEKAPEVGETLTGSRDVRKISFTGSTRVGKLLMKQSSETVKRLSLELGGNAPFIVFEDADLDKAVDGLMISKFRNTGQTCVCSNRVFVHESVYDEFTRKLVARVEALKIGLPREPGTQLGPVIGRAAFEKTSALVADALSKGAKALTGGKPAPELGGNYYHATVLAGVNDSMRVWSEEIFGPVAPLFSFSTESEVIEQANCTDAGLAGYFYSNDMSRVWRVASALECGMVGVNTGIVSYAQAPFGGVKQSGLGREGSPLGLDEYTETKFICMGGLDL